MEKEAFERSAVKEVVSSLVKNFGDMAAACLVDEMSSSKEDLERLKVALDKKART